MKELHLTSMSEKGDWDGGWGRSEVCGGKFITLQTYKIVD